MISVSYNLESCNLCSVVSEIIGTQILFSLLKLIFQSTVTNLSCSPNNTSNSSGQYSNSVLSRSCGRFVWKDRNHITMSSGYKLKPSWQDEQIQLFFSQTAGIHLCPGLPGALEYICFHSTGGESALICCNQCLLH